MRRSRGRRVVVAIAALGALAACADRASSAAPSAGHHGAHAAVITSAEAAQLATELSNPAPLASSTKQHKLLFGITLPGLPTGNPASMTALTQKETLLHHAIPVVSYFQSWSGPFSTNAATNVWNSGSLPMLSWDPYSPSEISHANGNPGYEKDWTLKQINSGRYDAYIKTTAQEMAALPFPIALRLAHEQNGFWYPWGIYTRGPTGKLVNTAAQYRAMWRHVWSIFHAAHADNVIFVWSPNQISSTQNNFGGTYPGDKYVGWLGISAYLHNTAKWSHISRSLTKLHQTAPTKPIMVVETAVGGKLSSGAAVNKTVGINNLLSHFATQPGLIGWVYFDLDAYRADWRFETSPSATAALRQGLQSSRYYAKLPATP